MKLSGLQFSDSGKMGGYRQGAGGKEAPETD